MYIYTCTNILALMCACTIPSPHPSSLTSSLLPHLLPPPSPHPSSLLPHLIPPPSSLTSSLLPPPSPHPSSLTSSLLPHLIPPPSPHPSSLTSSLLPHLIPPPSPHPSSLTSSLLPHLIPPPSPHPSSLTSSLLPHLIPPPSPHPSSPPLTTQVDGNVVLEGMISLYWGLKKPIVLAPGAIYAKQKMQYRDSIYEFIRSEDATYLQILDQATKRRDLSDKEVKWLKDISDSIAECQAEGAAAQGEDNNRESELMDKPVKYDDTLRKSQFDQYSDPKDFESGLDASSNGEVVRRTLGSMRPRSNTQVRKRSASFRKVSKQKKMEESRLSEVSWAWGLVYRYNVGGWVMSLLQWMGKAERGELGLGTSLQVQCGGGGGHVLTAVDG